MNGYQVVRIDATGPELHCRYCDEFWPLDLEHWLLKPDGQVIADRCRLCHNERGRLYQTLRRMDPSFREREKERARIYYRNWYRPHISKHYPSLLEAYDRENRERRRQAFRERRAA